MKTKRAPATVSCLDRAAASKRIAELVALDSALLDELGDDYSHERWTAENFLKDLPGKWALSRLVISPDGEVAGFWIASGSAHGVHTHRVAVAAPWRRRGVGEALWRGVRDATAALGTPNIALSVGVGNSAATEFYERIGFRRLTGEALRRFAARPGWGPVDGDEVLQPHAGRQHRYHVWVYSLEGK